MSGSVTRKEQDDAIVVNGWKLLPHPALLDQLEALEAQVIAKGVKSAAAKVFKWALEAIFEDIPRDPANPYYRQGGTLGKEYTGWFRDKYAGRFRLFFRYDLDAKEIVPAWVNDEQSKRTRGAKTDAYAVFKKMLDGGYPPNDWDELRKAAADPDAIARLQALRDRSQKA